MNTSCVFCQLEMVPILIKLVEDFISDCNFIKLKSFRDYTKIFFFFFGEKHIQYRVRTTVLAIRKHKSYTPLLISTFKSERHFYFRSVKIMTLTSNPGYIILNNLLDISVIVGGFDGRDSSFPI